MNKRGVGVAFCFIAALLYIAHYVSAAIFLSNVSSWDEKLFNDGLNYIGNSLDICSIIVLIVGIVYLLWAEVEIHGKNKEK